MVVLQILLVQKAEIVKFSKESRLADLSIVIFFLWEVEVILKFLRACKKFNIDLNISASSDLIKDSLKGKVTIRIESIFIDLDFLLSLLRFYLP